jgi:hypothetical protein
MSECDCTEQSLGQSVISNIQNCGELDDQCMIYRREYVHHNWSSL